MTFDDDLKILHAVAHHVHTLKCFDDKGGGGGT